MFQFKKAALPILMALGLFSLGACASAPGNLAGLGNDSMSMLVVHVNPDRLKPLTTQEYKVVVDHANSCLKDVHQQQASLAEVVVTNVAIDATASYLSSGPAIQTQAGILGSHLVKNAVPAVSAANAIGNGALSAGNALRVKSNAVTGIVGNCTNGDLHDSITAVKAPYVHVYGSTVRTSNSSKRVPSWVVPASNVPVRLRQSDIRSREPDQQEAGQQ